MELALVFRGSRTLGTRGKRRRRLHQKVGEFFRSHYLDCRCLGNCKIFGALFGWISAVLGRISVVKALDRAGSCMGAMVLEQFSVIGAMDTEGSYL